MIDLSQLSPEVARGLVPGALAGNVTDEAKGAVREGVGTVMSEATDDEVVALLQAFGKVGEGFKLHPADPLARRISHAFIPALIPSHEVVGLDRALAACAAGPTLWLSNHFSYVDTQATDYLLALCGADDLAQRIVAVAGPKVYGTPFRKMASVCLNTLKTAQSTRLSHNQAELSPREVARIAINTLRTADAFAREGRPILVYAEGARSRTGRLQPFLKAVSKYARAPGIQVIPVSISGTAELYPIDAELMRPAPVRLVLGDPVPAEEFGRVGALEECWRRVAAGLPEAHRPLPETPVTA